MPYTKRPKVTRNLQGEVRDIKDESKRSAPKKIDNSWIESYWLARDRIIYKECDEESKQQILERYGK